MATVLYEGARPFNFLVSEASGTRSRATATVETGQADVLEPGTLVEWNSTKLTEFTGTVNTDGLVTEAAGILLTRVDATAADVDDVVYLARDAEVNWNQLIYPADTTDTADADQIKASLALLGIITRD